MNSFCYSIDPVRLNVTLAQLSLIQLDADEKTLPVLTIHVHPSYDAATKFNDIALLEVRYKFYK